MDAMNSKSGTPLAQFALDRMREAHKKGNGIRLSWEELDAFSRTLIGSWWCQPNPELESSEDNQLNDADAKQCSCASDQGGP
jgi:hypothetical protein